MDIYVMQTDVDSFIIYIFIFRQNDSLTESNIRLDTADDRITKLNIMTMEDI